MEDLWAFNDERVARAIYDCEIPVISAVGHEPDVTIADYVADLRAATPSNAAELAAPDCAELLEAVSAAQERMQQAVTKQIKARRGELEDLASRRVMRSPTGFIDQRRLELDSVRLRLDAAEARIISAKRAMYASLGAKLDALSPLKVLGRGYSIALDGGGRALRSSTELSVGDSLRLLFASGQAECTVDSVTEGDSDGTEKAEEL